MKVIMLVLCLPFSCIICAQQVFVKQWDKRFGGTGEDMFISVIQCSDNGFLLCGSSSSKISGDKTENNCDTTSSSDPNTNGWIVKTDALGNKLWDKKYGGFSNGNLIQMQQTFDEGYILEGLVSADSGCDVTEPTRGGYDYWMVKIDASGNKQWDKRFGGTHADYPSAIQQTPDSGYIIAGESNSPIKRG